MPCILILSKFYSPTDAQVNCLKNNFKIDIKIDIKIVPTCLGVVTPSSGIALFELAEVKVVKRINYNTGLFISPSGISELDCATTKTDTAERSISIGRESLQVFFVLGALAFFQVPPLGGSREEKWRSQ